MRGLLPLRRALAVCVTVLAAFAAVLAGSAATATPAAAEEIRVIDARFGVHREFTRFVLELSESADPTIFTLAEDGDSPYRVVLDMPRLDWLRKSREIQAGRGLVARMRYSATDPGRARVVLDMPRPAGVKSVQTIGATGERGFRLVIDLAPTDRDTFLRTAGAPAVMQAALPGTGAADAMPELPIAVPSKRVIVLDPGHGGKDPGAIGKSGTHEKDVVLKMAKKFKDELEATGKYTVHLTRTTDVYIRLSERVAVAREKNADLFISVHADSIPGQRVRGASVYTLSETASDKEAARLAQKENASDIIAGVDLASEANDVISILVDLAQRDTMNNSVRFARTLLPEFEQRGVKLLKNTHRFAGFRVLTAPDVPSVLLEIGYMSDRNDERNFKDKKWQKKMASSIRTAIDTYFAERTAFALPVATYQ